MTELAIQKHIIDARRMLCPMPVIKLQNQVLLCNVDDEIELICTDPGALQDVPSWCRIYKHDLMKTEQQDNEIRFFIKVKKQ